MYELVIMIVQAVVIQDVFQLRFWLVCQNCLDVNTFKLGGSRGL